MITAAALVSILGILALAWENGILAAACAAIAVIMLCVRFLP